MSDEPGKLSSAEALEAAYALETPDDNRTLYRDWASTYDSEFIDATGYVFARGVAEVFDRYTKVDGPVLGIRDEPVVWASHSELSAVDPSMASTSRRR